MGSKDGQTALCSVDEVEAKEKGTGGEPPHTMVVDKQFNLTGEPLFKGKGKRGGLASNH
jgi:hypothetical protein